MTPAEFLKRYSSEPRLIPLNRLGVGKLNRGGQPLNGCHVETLMRRWHKGRKAGGEDFQTYRYKPARVYEPNPFDLQETLRHTNLMAAKDPRIRPVSDDTGKGLYGLFSKSHCWSALWGLIGRSIRLAAQDGEESFVIAPPRDQSELAFAEEHGLWCEVVRWEGVATIRIYGRSSGAVRTTMQKQHWLRTAFPRLCISGLQLAPGMRVR